MTELELLRLQLAGIPVHKHTSPKRGEWFCRSPYCDSVIDEQPRVGPGEPVTRIDDYDLGELHA